LRTTVQSRAAPCKRGGNWERIDRTLLRLFEHLPEDLLLERARAGCSFSARLLMLDAEER